MKISVTGGFKTQLRKAPGYAALRLLYGLLRGGEHRNIALLRLRQPENLFQPYPTTAENRYPHIFRFVRERIGDGPDRRLLSFGCSTGEEVFSLRGYFPEATIRGLDINPRAVAVCQKKLADAGDPRLSFAVAGSAVAEKAESCDAVFAMAVFRHGDLKTAPPHCDGLLRFEQFERTVAGLARCLRPGGLLVIRHANFRFADTAAAAGFEPALTIEDPPDGAQTPLYGPDNRLIAPQTRHAAVFRKIPPSAPVTSAPWP